MSHLEIQEREAIHQYLSQGKGVREISRLLQRSPSTISTEIRRNGMSKESYSPSQAQSHYRMRRGACRKAQRITPILQELIETKLLKRWSPEQISHYLRSNFHDYREYWVSHETIYTFIYRTENRDFYTQFLRRKRKKRHLRSSERSIQKGIKNRRSIRERPAEVEERLIPGHWEGDLIIGRGHESALGTLVERTSRYTILIPLKRGKDSFSVAYAFSQALKKMPESLRKSLTYDCGSEMAQHELLSKYLKMPIYFADPGCPWQRGSNENTNGLVRDFYPKKTDFDCVSEAEIKRVESWLNERPRKVLGFKSPQETLQKLETSK